MERGQLPKIYPPATPQRVAAAEEELGFGLPALLRDIYLKVGNGGFGPGLGLFPLAGGLSTHEREETLVETYLSFRYRSERVPWGERLLPICTWGCTYFSYLDCALPEAPVMALDENSHGDGPWGCASSLHAKSFEEWMQRWLDGEDLWASIDLSGEPKFYEEEQRADGAPVHLSRNFRASPEAVFAAWITPTVASRWLFKRPDSEIVHAEMDARISGRYSVRVNTESQETEYSGVYEAIERPHRIAFSLLISFLDKSSRVTIDITPVPNGCRLDLTHTGLPGRVVIGPWNYMLDTLGRVLSNKT